MSSSSPHDPSLTQRFAREPLKKLAAHIGKQPVVGRVRHFIDGLRSDVRAAAHGRMPEVGVLAERLARRMFAESQSELRPAINATGVLCPRELQVPLADAALEAVATVARDYAKSQSGDDAAHGRAESAVERLLRELTGAPAALVLATHGAAVLATLAALARGRELVVARSQVAAVGGNYPLPEAAAQAGALVHEVGLANEVTLDDYRRAIGAKTAIVFRHVSSDFALSGRIGSVDLDALVELAAASQTPVVENIEGASLIDFAPLGGASAPIVGQSIVAGADLVIFGGERYLGGPACGIIVGARPLIDRIAQHPLARALAADKLTASALEATLRLYRDPPLAAQAIPLVQLLSASVDNLQHRANRLAPQIERSAAVGRVEAVPRPAYLGEGRLSDEQIPSWCLAIEPAEGDAQRLAEALRETTPSVWAAVENHRLLLNLRSVLARQDEQIVAAFRSLGEKPDPDATAATPQTTPDPPAAVGGQG